jgi:hypothetical protein
MSDLPTSSSSDESRERVHGVQIVVALVVHEPWRIVPTAESAIHDLLAEAQFRVEDLPKQRRKVSERAMLVRADALQLTQRTGQPGTVVPGLALPPAEVVAADVANLPGSRLTNGRAGAWHRA